MHSVCIGLMEEVLNYMLKLQVYLCFHKAEIKFTFHECTGQSVGY